MAIASFYEKQWQLARNPFSNSSTYNEDSDIVYVPEMFGSQRHEFLRKFVLAPLENGQPLLGAVWSVVPGDPKARGFGKSTMMGEEAKLINKDFGFGTLQALGVDDEEASDNPIMAGYVSFNTKANEGINNIDAAGFHLVRFLLRGLDTSGTRTHQRLRERAAARLVKDGKAAPGKETDAIVNAIRDRFKNLAVTIDIRNLIEEFLFHLAGPDSDALDSFMASVGAWQHNRNGLKYLQLFVVFAELAGIQHLTFFLDQVEDFTSEAGNKKIQKNVKIIRDALIESEPFASRASFILQLHPDAYHRLRDAWAAEDLRDLNYDPPLNAPFVVVLKGLDTFKAARQLAERCLNDESNAVPGRKPGIWPFDEAALKRVWEATKPRPRWFLRILHDLLVTAKTDRIATLDEKYVIPKLQGLSEVARRDADADDVAGDDRLT